MGDKTNPHYGPKLPRICHQCGGTFMALTARAKWCSRGCRQDNWRPKREEAKQAKAADGVKK